MVSVNDTNVAGLLADKALSPLRGQMQGWIALGTLALV
jgi:hypothetical protein